MDSTSGPAVVVAGTGVASPVLDHPAGILALKTGASGTAFDPAALLGRRGLRFKDRSTRLALLAATRALADASLVDDGPADGPAVKGGSRADDGPPVTRVAVPGPTVGVVASSNLGNLDTVCRAAETIASRSVIATKPMDLPNASSNIIASTIAIWFGLRGPNLMVCNGASSGVDAVHLASVLIGSGRVLRVVVVGVEPVNDVVAKLTGRAEAELFDGAAAAVLESEAATEARGLTPVARLGGYARRADAAASVEGALGGVTRPGLWLAEATTAAPATVQDIPRRYVEPQLGAASGALGVLQVVAGVHWLASGGEGPVLVTAGVDDDGVSSLLVARASGWAASQARWA